MKKIRVLYVKDGGEPKVIEVENILKALKSLVDGYIETVSLPDALVLVLNEEGKLIGLPYSGYTLPWGDPLMGNFFIVASDNRGEFISLTDNQIKEVKEILGSWRGR